MRIKNEKPNIESKRMVAPCSMLHALCSRGFTLVETILYIFVLTIIVSITTLSVTTSFKFFEEIKSNRNIIDSSVVAMERISREIKQADSVDSVSSVFGTSPGSLYISTTESGTTYTRSFAVSGGEIVLSQNGTVVGSLTSSNNVTINSLIFYRIVTSRGDAIRVVLTVSDTSSSPRSVTFYNTINLR